MPRLINSWRGELFLGVECSGYVGPGMLYGSRAAFCVDFFGRFCFAPTTWVVQHLRANWGPFVLSTTMTGSLRNGSLEFRKTWSHGPLQTDRVQRPTTCCKRSYSILFQSHVSTRWVGKSCQIIKKNALYKMVGSYPSKLHMSTKR